MSERSELIAGLRQLADLLAQQPLIPTPVGVAAVAAHEWVPGDGFTCVLDLVEKMAPCTNLPGPDPDHRAITRLFGPVELRVLIPADAVGEFRIIERPVETFMVDTEVRRAGEDPKA